MIVCVYEKERKKEREEGDGREREREGESDIGVCGRVGKRERWQDRVWPKL